MDPAISASLAAFALCFCLCAVGPAPRRTPPGERVAYLALLAAGIVTFAAAAALAPLGLWVESMAGFLSAFSLVLFCMWLARSPLKRDQREDEDEDGGGGGGRRPPADPDPPGPRGGLVPPEPSLDWGAFDDQRAGWERPADDRELVSI